MRKFSAKAVLLGLLGFLVSARAFAYPELVRHNYPNCTACHVSPNGGGVLTPYGRQLSADVLSTWGAGNENESKFAWGVVDLPKWIDLIGMQRNIYTYRSTPYVSTGDYTFMQGDIEAAAHAGQWIFDAALGYQVSSGNFFDHLISRRHYVNYRPTDELSFRVGRFFPAYGIYTENHYVATRRGLGFDEGQESYNVEAAWIGSTWNAFVTGILGRPDQPSLHREQGFAVTPSANIADHYKVGVSYLYGNASDTARDLFGAWGLLGFTPHFFLLSEWDLQHLRSKTGAFDDQFGAANYQRLDYEIIQGVHVYLTEEYLRLNFADQNSLSNSFGLGAQWFPRPHFELNLSWQKLKIASLSSDYTDFAWVMLNIYI